MKSMILIFAFLLHLQADMALEYANTCVDQNVSGWLLSEKFDGIRAIWDGKKLLTRTGKTLNAPKSFLKNLPPFSIDGELWLGRQRFEETASIVLKKEAHPDWDNITYRLFEAPYSEGNFTVRMLRIEHWFSQHPNPHIRIIPQTRVANLAEARKIMKQWVRAGAEGVMLKNPSSPYTPGRSDHLLKLKPHDDDEGMVIGYKNGQGKYSGMVGSLHIRLKNGKTFYLGSGLSDRERKEPPPIGSRVTFKYHGLTVNGLPRFATYWRIRP